MNFLVFHEVEEGFPSMRCEDVIRELAAPSDAQDAAALSDHLSHCLSCAAFADRAARLDRLWEATRPAEPGPEVWHNLWLQIAQSMDSSTSQPVVSLSPVALRNGSTNAPKYDVKPSERSPSRSSRSQPWARFGTVGVSRAAAALLIAGLAWWFFGPSNPNQDVASLNRTLPEPTGPNVLLASLSDIDIEAGHTVVILADTKSPSVVDRTAKGIIAGVDREYVDWYGDERYFDWSQVFNEVEYLAKPQVAMKE